MTFEEYSKQAIGTAVYPATMRVIYPTLGLTGEAGEVAEKVKKLYRDQNGVLNAEVVQNIKLELGDVLWYINAMCRDLGLTLEEVAQANIEKLSSRAQRGQIHGNGDKR
mgnify:CR=1 FL=1|jgi:NTP pyrophosphatase (non-canonical NTP hydrolase)